MPLRPYIETDGVPLYHGDCRDVLPELQPEAFEFVLTDPPYLVNHRGRWGSGQRAIEGDSDPGWIEPVFGEVWRVLKPDSLCASFYGWPHAELFVGTLEKNRPSAGEPPLTSQRSLRPRPVHPHTTRDRVPSCKRPSAATGGGHQRCPLRGAKLSRTPPQSKTLRRFFQTDCDVLTRQRLRPRSVLRQRNNACCRSRPRTQGYRHRDRRARSEEHTSELQSHSFISYAVFC